MKISQYFSASLLSVALSVTLNFPAIAEQHVASTTVTNNSTKQALMTKLASVDYFSASFKQNINSVDGELLQTGVGKISISKPSLVYWETTEPDETLIVSDGLTLWFYDPFIEQATAYSLDAAIKNTPILLLTNNDEALWQQYDVSELKDTKGDIIKERYLVKSRQENSQVKTLTLTFNGKALSRFSFEDATGQISEIILSDYDMSTKPKANLFTFTLPEGVRLEDKR